MPGHGPWESYSQSFTLFADSSDGIAIYHGWTKSVFTSFGTTDGYDDGHHLPGIWEDSALRVCAWQHVVAGSGSNSDPMPWGWNYYGGNTCPPIYPGGDYGTSADDISGIVLGLTSTGRTGVQRTYELAGSQGEFGVVADTSTGPSGLPSWQDPGVQPPPPTGTIDGRTYPYEYEFTSIDATLGFHPTMSSATVITAPGFVVEARPTLFHPTVTGWVSSAISAGDFTMSVDSVGGVSVAGSRYVPDLTAGYSAYVGASAMESGGNVGGDPGSPPFTQHARPQLASTVVRHGRRRLILPSTPPLHQRQRTDGLGGGPVHSGASVNSRQRGLFARGIF